ncbi:hypothetical protein [Acinetobacter johnsonii]|uniref:Uncharacterized protein n=1 Tax=Acinetobacter johnsonii TaxID=40214 RepID=A0AAJ6IES7_ACIJO|nr:hypothetical protein [Acinetobacter johnsonii]MDH1532959.1 hypothetical protein [Acinetobacter johnsonii]WMG17598.1 hypothetical protein QBJ73_14645 [Acinetobacter johnsonii]
MSNPETIEIQGLETIHKLCKFGADHNMEGCSFTEIVERMFDELTKAKSARGAILSCQQLKKALEFGAPDLFSETKGLDGDLEFQLETEMSIEFIKDGHSGSGYYCWYYDLPEEGSIILGDEAQEQSHECPNP